MFVKNAQLVLSMMLILQSAVFLALLMKFITLFQEFVSVLLLTTKSKVSANNVKEILPLMQSVYLVSALLDILKILKETAFWDAVLMKFSRMDFVVAKKDTTLLMEFAECVNGTKSMIKGLESAEFLVMPLELSILVSKPVFASLTSMRWLMELAKPALFTQFMIHSQKAALVKKDISRVLDFAFLHAMPMKPTLMENAFVEKDTILLDTAVDFALQLKFTMLLIVFATNPAKPMKFGTPSSELADAFPDTTSSMMSVVNAIPELKSTVTDTDAAFVLKDIKEEAVKDATESALLSVQLTKTTF